MQKKQRIRIETRKKLIICRPCTCKSQVCFVKAVNRTSILHFDTQFLNFTMKIIFEMIWPSFLVCSTLWPAYLLTNILSNSNGNRKQKEKTRCTQILQFKILIFTLETKLTSFYTFQLNSTYSEIYNSKYVSVCFFHFYFFFLGGKHLKIDSPRKERQ